MGKKRIVLVIAGVIVCVLVGVFIGRIGQTSAKNATSPTNQSKDYPLLAKRIFLEDPNEPFVNFAPLRDQLNSYFDANNPNGNLYFEYLPTGTSIRVAGDEREGAASLMKVPAAMDLYKAAELGRIDLNKKVALKEEWLDNGFGDLYKKGAGYEISLRDAARIMLEDSDNTALKAVAGSTTDVLTQEESALGALDVDFAQNNNLSVKISPRSYSSFLKCLYYSCYLNKENSQELLGYLSNTKFKDRLVAGIKNDNVKVAHKIGVYNTTVQSDCGIVYLEKRNYVLCIMLNGDDNEQTDKQIADISKKVYDYVANIK